MKFKSFKIKNYKGIESLDIDLDKNNLFCILGLNESGKTTLLKAIDMWQRIAQGTPLQNGEKQKIKPKFKGVLWSGKISVAATIDIQDKREDLIREHQLSEGTVLPSDITIEYTYEVQRDVIDDQHKLNHTLKIDNVGQEILENIVKKIASSCPNIIYYDDFNIITPNSIKFSKTGEPVNNNIWHDVLNDALISLTEDISSDLKKDIIPKLFEADHKIAFSNNLSRLSNHIDEKISDLWKEQLTRLEADITEYKEVELRHDILENEVAFSFRINTKEGISFELSERSKGFIWFFCFVLFTTLRKHRSPNSVFLLDEPASNLHGNIQEKVIEALIDLSDKNAVIYTTHSPYMLNDLYLDSTYLMVNTSAESLKEQNTKNITIEHAISYIDSSKNKDFYVRPLYDYLKFSLPPMYPISDCVLVEGITDYKLLNFCTKVFDIDFKFNFIPCHGAHSMGNVIQNLDRHNANYLILLDADKEGKSAKARYNESKLEKAFSYHDLGLKDIKTIEDMFTEKAEQVFKEHFSLPQATRKKLLHAGVKQTMLDMNKDKTKNLLKKIKPNIKQAVFKSLLDSIQTKLNK